MRSRCVFSALVVAGTALMLVTVLAAPTAAAASHAVDGPKGADDWEIPNMRAALDDAWSADDAAPIHAASVGGADADELDVEAASADGARPRQTDAELCGLPNVAAAGCPALLTPGAGWWTGGAERRNAFLMSVLMRDNYPIVHNLGADNDDTPQKKALWQCLMRSKWLALGAEKVEFYESLLNTIVFIKVGNSVFANLRGTWTDAHRKSNMEWRLGSSKRLWGQEVRYHKGWGKTAEDAYSAIRTAVTDSFGIRDGNCNLYLSGHSRGAGAALLVAARTTGR
ncbi:hypothetical protein MNEG_16393 [Monoraphidium neglectum]|uniref:Fungal lipase-type domain-containing protein n=1 Tax=Monoraphidium neglectum TaxID=145388 RepID=A0A0D2LNK5_9CHLO|nr:hypothetical protein MNEG_16393 [Monoraphidium neglectum]KIY91571.1 hypothetical protein MNEG_16393 [Monoraphidium neglectum]|eukprot:XP_013890591.1 hypothetical protein MNEG_16393 [Monoraphidium neglectum]